MFDFLKKLLGLGPATDYKALLQNGAQIVDVRTAGEYNGGHIKNSINIPLDQVGSKIAFLKSKNVPIITVCRSGNRSGMAKGILVNAGLEVYNGGAWNSLEAAIK